MRIINVVLTGGAGSRLWPLSRKSCPKQYVSLFGDRTLFQMTVERNRAITDEVLIVGNRGNHQLSVQQLEETDIKQPSYITEAAPRNTAPAIAFAAFSAKEEDILLVTPSDHIISDTDQYKESVQRAVELAAEGKALIMPSWSILKE